MGQLRFQLTIMKWLVLISLVSLVKSEDYSCPSGKSTKTITVKDGDSFSFNSNPDDADNYENKEKCTVKYKRGGSCKELKFECQSFNLQKGDKLIIGKNKYFLDEDVSETTTKKVMKVRFISNKKKTGSGAQCTIECSDPEAPGVTESPSTTEGGSDGGSVPSNAEFCQVDSDHTMCKYEGPSDTCSAQTIYRELSADAKQAILDKHNELRRKVAKGEETDGAPGPQPAASNMRKLVWNNELEAVAQRWADQCQFGHDSSRNKLDGTAVGQNAYWGGSSVESEEAAVQAGMINAAQAWYDEVSDPGFDSGSISPYVFSSGTGHYTQVVWADTEELGCGMVYYKGSSWYETLIVCNYAISGNWMGGEMYKSGDACSSCPDGYTCDDGLCAAP